METATMGRVTVTAKLENSRDLGKVDEGLLRAEQVRSVVVNDALVGTGATGLAGPPQVIAQLGLTSFRTRNARTSNGTVVRKVYGPVRLTIEGRDGNFDITELSDGCPVLIGQVPLEMLDFVVDPKNRRLVGNPEHGGDFALDFF